jgi:uncharacterized glyoxalase superfamily protein PhnB
MFGRRAPSSNRRRITHGRQDAKGNEGRYFAFRLRNDSLVLSASDMCSSDGLIKGNSVSLLLNCSSEEEIKNFYTKLSAGGEATHPLENTFWGAVFGDLKDKFGNHWLLNFTKDQNQQSPSN